MAKRFEKEKPTTFNELKKLFPIFGINYDYQNFFLFISSKSDFFPHLLKVTINFSFQTVERNFGCTIDVMSQNQDKPEAAFLE
jgi:hypothetical protein